MAASNSPYDGQGIYPVHLARHVITPVLSLLDQADPGINSRAALELVLATAAQESGLRALDQYTGPGDSRLGPAMGLWQAERAAIMDLHRNYIDARPAVERVVHGLMIPGLPVDEQVVGNLYYAAALCRLHYRRSPHPLPQPGDAAGHARLWKAAYNTPAGKGRVEDFAANWHRLVAPVLAQI